MVRTTPAALLLFLTAACGGESESRPALDRAKMAELVPADACVIVRLESFAEVARRMQALAAAGGHAGAAPRLTDFGLRGVDPGLPLAIALSLRDGVPVVTVVAGPDGSASSPMLPGRRERNGWVALASAPDGPAGPCPLWNELPKGVLAAVADGTRLRTRFGPAINAALASVKSFAERLRATAPPAGLLLPAADFIQQAAESAGTVRATLDFDDDVFATSLEWEVVADSPLARRKKGRLRELLAGLDPGAAIVSALHLDVQKLLEGLLPKDPHGDWAQFLEVLEGLQSEMAFDGDVHEQTLRATGAWRSEGSAATVDRIVRMVRERSSDTIEYVGERASAEGRTRRFRIHAPPRERWAKDGLVLELTAMPDRLLARWGTSDPKDWPTRAGAGKEALDLPAGEVVLFLHVSGRRMMRGMQSLMAKSEQGWPFAPVGDGPPLPVHVSVTRSENTYRLRLRMHAGFARLSQPRIR